MKIRYAVADTDELGESCVMTITQMRHVLHKLSIEWATDERSLLAQIASLDHFAGHSPDRAIELVEKTNPRARAELRRILGLSRRAYAIRAEEIINAL